ncbi:MAG: sulfurtransferase TusA family protein [Myxococcales bacterium]
MSLDITNLLCPMTYVRTRLALEGLAAGEELEVRLKGREPLENIPRSATEEGHLVREVREVAPGIHVVVICKDGASNAAARSGRS